MRLEALSLMLLVATPLAISEVAGSEVSAVLERLQETQLVSGRFEQTRREDGLPQPLSSSGRFLFWRAAGVVWATEQPLQQTTIYRRDKTLYRESAAAPARELKGRSERYFRQVLLDVFSLDEKQLADNFETQWRFDGQGRWQLLMAPTSRSMQRAIERVVLSGAEQIETLQIVFVHGNSLSMYLSEHELGADISLEMCMQYFAYEADQCEQRLRSKPH